MHNPMLLALLGPAPVTAPCSSIEVDGTPLSVLPRGTSPPSLAVSFDEAAARLQDLPGMFFEPDGAFFWRSPADPFLWLVDGELYDGGTTLHHALLRLRRESPPPWQTKPWQTKQSDPTEPSSRPEGIQPAIPAPFDRLLPCLGVEDFRATVELPAVGAYAALEAFLDWFARRSTRR